MSGGVVERIVAIDAYGVNPGDLSWERFERFGSLTVYDHSSQEEIVARARGATAVLVDRVALGEGEIAQLTQLRYIGLFATGHDQVDVEAARRREIAVTHVPGYSTPSVAQMTFALLLTLASRVCEYAGFVHGGRWVAGREFRYLEGPLVELSGKTLGILGMGPIGMEVARIAAAFGMEVIAWSRRPKKVPGVSVTWVEQPELFRRADVVTLHVPLVPQTAGIVNSETLGLMKRSAFLVNTARGGLARDVDLAEALHAGTIAGAALDVVGRDEPPAADNPLLAAPNCVITPHVAWATRAARDRCLEEAARNLEAALNGGSRNRLV